MSADNGSVPERVIILPRDDYNRAQSKAPQALTDPSTLVIPVPLRPPMANDPVIRDLVAKNDAWTVLVRNPWGANRRVQAAMAYEQISVAKFNALAEVCQLLGARDLRVTEIRQIDRSNKVTGTAKYGGGAMAVDASGEVSTLTNIANSISAVWKWKPGRVNVEAARRHAESLGIGSDPTVGMLIRQRTEGGLASHELSLDISAEARREVDAAIKIMSVLKKLGPQFDGTLSVLTSQTDRLSVHFSVTF